MEDLGQVVSFLGLHDGVPVYDREGKRVGVVDGVIETGGIFEGLIIHTPPVVGGRHLFATHDQIAELREHGVLLAVGREELYELNERAGRRRHDVDGPDPAIEALLRKAWDRLVGVR